MKKFVELIERVHKERFSVVMNKIVTEKIPVAFLSTAPLQNSVINVKNMRAKGLNIVDLIVTDSAPPHRDWQVNFRITPLNKSDKLHLFSEYIFTNPPPPCHFDFLDSRVAVKHFPNNKCITLAFGSDVYYQAFMEHLTDLKEVYKSLIDEESKKVFCGYWLAKILNQMGEAVYSNTPHYILSGFLPKPGNVVIDVGSMDGYDSSKFVNLGCKVYAFEMDSTNFQKAVEVAHEKNFIIENVGLGSYKHTAHYNHVVDLKDLSGVSHLDNQGALITKVITLDSYVAENKFSHVDFIKIDTEGAELDVLRGATLTMARFKPILAVSAYHKPDDFWVLMNFIKSIRPDYEFALRQYGGMTEDHTVIPYKNYLDSFGLEPHARNYNAECVLFAR